MTKEELIRRFKGGIRTGFIRWYVDQNETKTNRLALVSYYAESPSIPVVPDDYSDFYKYIDSIVRQVAGICSGLTIIADGKRIF